jgi:hypothetical protein
MSWGACIISYHCSLPSLDIRWASLPRYEAPAFMPGSYINVKPQFLIEGGVKAPSFLTGFTEIPGLFST